jgi:hypothetical protein
MAAHMLAKGVEGALEQAIDTGQLAPHGDGQKKRRRRICFENLNFCLEDL